MSLLSYSIIFKVKSQKYPEKQTYLEEAYHDPQHKEIKTDDCTHHSLGDRSKCTCNPNQKGKAWTKNEVIRLTVSCC